MKLKYVTFIVIVLLTIILVPSYRLNGCTTAVINADATVDGRPILWKNRDTGYLSNKVIYVKETPYSYIGLVNSHDNSGKWVYAGMNNAGFGIMNSVAYNLPKDETEVQDLEGRIMADALRVCRSIDDFETFIKQNMGASMGAWTNFCVVDHSGQTAIFETHNNGYKKYSPGKNDRNYLVNTNFSRSGKEGKGDGYLRFQQASRLFQEIPEGKINPQYILKNITRDFGHSLLKHPTLKDLEAISVQNPSWINSRDCINRPFTASAVVMVGNKPGDNDSVSVFWVILGEPVTAIALPVFVAAKETPTLMWEGDDAPLCKESARIKAIIRPYSEKDKKNYMNLSLLKNKEGTGFLHLLLETEQEIFKATASFLRKQHTAQEYAAFQNQMAQKAMDTLKKIKP